MKNFKMLRDSINIALQSETFIPEDNDNGHANKMITGCLLFEILMNLSNVEAGSLNSMVEIANNYLSSYKSIVESIRGVFVSHSYMKKKIREFDVSYFSELDESQINEICKLYQNKERVTDFSDDYFHYTMYNVIETSSESIDRLEMVHNKVMAPIFSHYKKKYNNKQKIIIYDSLLVPSNPGKKIVFELPGISSTRIIFDVFVRDILNVKQYIYAMKLYENHICITIK